MCPLARQGDFYVPEVKETERKSRGSAETSDTQVDGTGTEAGDEVVEEAPPWLGCTGRCPGCAWPGWEKEAWPPQGPAAELPVPRHLGPCRCEVVHVTSCNTGAAIAPDSLQVQREYLGNTDPRQLATRGRGLRLLRTGITWVGSSGNKIGPGLEGKGSKVLSCSPVWGPTQSQCLLPAEERQRAAGRSS